MGVRLEQSALSTSDGRVSGPVQDPDGHATGLLLGPGSPHRALSFTGNSCSCRQLNSRAGVPGLTVWSAASSTTEPKTATMLLPTSPVLVSGSRTLKNNPPTNAPVIPTISPTRSNLPTDLTWPARKPAIKSARQ